MTLILISDVVATNTIGSVALPMPPRTDYLFKLDFNAGVYTYRQGTELVASTLAQAINFSRTTKATYRNSSGVIVDAAINEPRLDYVPSVNKKGLLIESATNKLLPDPTSLTTQTLQYKTPSLKYDLGLVLTVEGEGSAIMSGNLRDIVGTKATQGSPQFAYLGYGVSPPSTSLYDVNEPITITVTGTITRLQLTEIRNDNVFGSPKSFVPQGQTSVGSDKVALSAMLSAKLSELKTIIVETIEPLPILRARSNSYDIFSITDSDKPNGGVYLRRLVPAISSGSEIKQILYSIPPNSTTTDRDVGIFTLPKQRNISALSMSSGGVHVAHAVNGILQDVATVGAANAFNALTLGGKYQSSLHIVSITAYDYEMTETELKAVTKLT